MFSAIVQLTCIWLQRNVACITCRFITTVDCKVRSSGGWEGLICFIHFANTVHFKICKYDLMELDLLDFSVLYLRFPIGLPWVGNEIKVKWHCSLNISAWSVTWFFTMNYWVDPSYTCSVDPCIFFIRQTVKKLWLRLLWLIKKRSDFRHWVN